MKEEIRSHISECQKRASGSKSKVEGHPASPCFGGSLILKGDFFQVCIFPQQICELEYLIQTHLCSESDLQISVLILEIRLNTDCLVMSVRGVLFYGKFLFSSELNANFTNSPGSPP